MPIDLPLPKVIADVGPGGGIVTAMRGINALTGENLDNRMKELQNQMFVPKTQADIDYHKALTNQLNTITPLTAQQMQLQNQYYVPKTLADIDYHKALTNQLNTITPLEAAYQRLVNQYYAPKMQADIAQTEAQTQRQNLINQHYNTTTDLQNAWIRQNILEQQIKNKFLPELQKADIQAQKSLANYRDMGGGYGMSAGLKDMRALQSQIMRDNPQFTTPEQANEAASQALDGKTTLRDGTPFNLTALATREVAQINKRSSTSAIQNQASNMDVLASDVNDIDITPVSKFVGLKGRLDYATYIADMAAGRPVPQEFRDYLAFKDVTSQFAMDALRKGFGTSVVPSYVYATLGKASDPSSNWWIDPQQVLQEWNTTKKWINDNAKKYKIKADKGASADLGSSSQSKPPESKDISKASNEKNDPLGFFTKKKINDPLGILS